ncbi:UGT2A1.2 family protein [Megaselia abdita]
MKKLFSILMLIHVVNSARILGFLPTPQKSHMIIHMSVMKILADAGHDVTVVTQIPYPDATKNYRHIKLDIPEILDSNFLVDVVNKPRPFYKLFMDMSEMVFRTSNLTIFEPQMQHLMANEEFDLVILGYFFNDFQIGVAAHFKCPIIINYMIQPITTLNDFVGNPRELSYVPNLFIEAKQPMGLIQRLKNFIYTEVIERILYGINDMEQRKYYNTVFPADKYPSYDDMKKNVSLVLVNHHFISQGPIRPNVPGIVEVGGVQLKQKANPLPKDIQDFMDEAPEDGVIYFCLGSNVKKGMVSDDRAKSIFNVLSKLPQRVIMKWDEHDVPGVSKNILYKEWLPQDDTLAHPKMRLFITHGGQGGVVESQYHGVPMVGIPLFGDQKANIANVVESGFGLKVDYTTLDEETFSTAVNEVLRNRKFRDNVKKFAELYRDRPQTVQETVRYWVDYVIRHRGAKHIQSPLVHLNFIEKNNIDLVVGLAIVLYIIVKVIWIVSRKGVRWVQKVKKE